MKIVIRAGGIGTRMWPMSRQSNPKQFQAIVGDKSMVRTTYDRVSLAAQDNENIFVSVNAAHEERIKTEIPELIANNLILETDVRNTGPAMCLEVAYLEKFCDKNVVIASLPSDDYISNKEAFADLLAMSEEFILKNPTYILTPAVRPAQIDTGYSYMKAGEELMKTGEEAIYQVADVVEKPNMERCAELIETGVYYCHTGMYIWQLGNIIDLFKKYQPAMYQICAETVELMISKADLVEIKKSYSRAEKMSIESAITDKAPALAMSVSDRIGWSDLGKWHIIKRMLSAETQDNLIKGKVITNKAQDNLVYNTVDKKVVIINDVQGLAIIDTPDALYISSLTNSADIKECLEQVKERGWEEYL